MMPTFTLVGLFEPLLCSKIQVLYDMTVIMISLDSDVFLRSTFYPDYPAGILQSSYLGIYLRLVKFIINILLITSSRSFFTV